MHVHTARLHSKTEEKSPRVSGLKVISIGVISPIPNLPVGGLNSKRVSVEGSSRNGTSIFKHKSKKVIGMVTIVKMIVLGYSHRFVLLLRICEASSRRPRRYPVHRMKM